MADTNTIVGETILVRGNLQGDEDLTVQGRIEGSLSLSRTLIIEQSGVVKADVSVNNAVVSGVMVGNLTATDSVELSETGRMVGDIHAPRVIVVEGALFKGKVDMGNLEMPRQTSSPAADHKTPSFTPRPAVRPEPVRKTPAAPHLQVKKAPVPVKKTISVIKKADSRSKKKVVVKRKRR
ncbi:MAG TPA: polymer-forming cytoskeletal protein [Myxococcota bacterium]|nr:polymer-forming cytoskeletal protein [Myxococcota bacterium]